MCIINIINSQFFFLFSTLALLTSPILGISVPAGGIPGITGGTVLPSTFPVQTCPEGEISIWKDDSLKDFAGCYSITPSSPPDPNATVHYVQIQGWNGDKSHTIDFGTYAAVDGDLTLLDSLGNTIEVDAADNSVDLSPPTNDGTFNRLYLAVAEDKKHFNFLLFDKVVGYNTETKKFGAIDSLRIIYEFVMTEGAPFKRPDTPAKVAPTVPAKPNPKPNPKPSDSPKPTCPDGSIPIWNNVGRNQATDCLSPYETGKADVAVGLFRKVQIYVADTVDVPKPLFITGDHLENSFIQVDDVPASNFTVYDGVSTISSSIFKAGFQDSVMIGDDKGRVLMGDPIKQMDSELTVSPSAKGTFTILLDGKYVVVGQDGSTLSFDEVSSTSFFMVAVSKPQPQKKSTYSNYILVSNNKT